MSRLLVLSVHFDNIVDSLIKHFIQVSISKYLDNLLRVKISPVCVDVIMVLFRTYKLVQCMVGKHGG